MVLGRSLVWIASLNPAGIMDVSFFSVVCVFFQAEASAMCQ
jgi:hypothetical protein